MANTKTPKPIFPDGWLDDLVAQKDAEIKRLKAERDELQAGIQKLANVIADDCFCVCRDVRDDVLKAAGLPPVEGEDND